MIYKNYPFNRFRCVLKQIMPLNYTYNIHAQSYCLQINMVFLLCKSLTKKKLFYGAETTNIHIHISD